MRMIHTIVKRYFLPESFHFLAQHSLLRHGMLLRYDSQSAANVNSKEPPAPTSALVEAAIQQIRIYIRGPDAGKNSNVS